MVHEHLECGWSIAEAKEHNGGFKESHWGNDGCFPLVLLSKMYVIIFPLYLEFCEYGGIFHVVDEFGDEG